MELFKVNTQNADEESFKIYSESTLLFTSPSLSDNHVLVLEQCLTASPNYQYTIELLDSVGNGWSDGSFLMVVGKNGNVAFKNTLYQHDKDTFPLSLYYGIAKNAAWKMTSGSITAGGLLIHSLIVLGQMWNLAL